MKLEIILPDKAPNKDWWRVYVLLRDNFTCQQCHRQLNGYRSLHTHHIKQDLNLKLVISNGETLCPDCHKLLTRWQRLKGRRSLPEILANKIN